MSEIDQIRAAHKAALPKPQDNPAWANTHHDLGVVLDALEARDKTIAELVSSLSDMKALIDRSHDSGDMVDGGDLRYWSDLIAFSISQAIRNGGK